MINPMQPLDPMSPPGPITPAASPSDPAGFASVFPHGQGPAPYDIQAPLMDAEITAAFNGANAVGGAGFLYPQGPRQAEAAALLDSAQGSPAMDVTAGYAGGGGGSWPSNPEPPEDAYNQYTPGNTPGSPTGV